MLITLILKKNKILQIPLGFFTYFQLLSSTFTYIQTLNKSEDLAVTKWFSFLILFLSFIRSQLQVLSSDRVFVLPKADKIIPIFIYSQTFSHFGKYILPGLPTNNSDKSTIYSSSCESKSLIICSYLHFCGLQMTLGFFKGQLHTVETRYLLTQELFLTYFLTLNETKYICSWIQLANNFCFA